MAERKGAPSRLRMMGICCHGGMGRYVHDAQAGCPASAFIAVSSALWPFVAKGHVSLLSSSNNLIICTVQMYLQKWLKLAEQTTCTFKIDYYKVP